MDAVQRRCEVAVFTHLGMPWCGGQASGISREFDRSRAGDRWWLGEPSRDVWVLACGPVTL